jgi:hypothetical protein
MTDDTGTIKEGEYHPAADSAMEYVKGLMTDAHQWSIWHESFASTALSGNRLAEICFSTMDRLNKSEPVSDRYLLGLAWILRNMQESEL